MKPVKKSKAVVSGRKAQTKKLSEYRSKPGPVSEKLRQKSRRQYRKSKGKSFELDGNTVLRAETFLDEEVMYLPVTNEDSGEVETLPVLRPTQVAKLLNITYQTFWRWTTDTAQVPQPILLDTTQGREYAVFHVDEVREMIRIIGKHMTEFRYYRKDHAATRQKLFKAIEAIRYKGFTNPTIKGNTTNGNRTQGQSTRKGNRKKSNRGRTEK